MMSANSALYFQVQPVGGQMQEYPQEWKESYIIGRQSSTGTQLCDIFIEDPYASRKHCRLFRDPKMNDGWLLEDLRSANGTKFNGNPVTRPVPFTEDCWIQVGTTRITFSLMSKMASLPSKSVMTSSQESCATSQDHGATVLDHMIEHGPSTNADATEVLAKAMPTQIQETALPDLAEDLGTIVDAMVSRSEVGELVLSLRPSMLESVVELGDEMGDIDDFNYTSPALPSELRLSPKLSVSSSSARQPVSDAHENAIRFAIHSPLIQEFLNANYLDLMHATKLLEESQHNGQTFFRTLARDRSVKYIDPIFRTLTQRYGWALITDEKELSAELITTDWLPINLAGDKGILALRSEDPHRVKFGTIDPFDVMTHDWVSRCANKPTDMVLIHPDLFFPTLRRLKESPGQKEEAVGVAVIEMNAEEEHLIREQIGSVDIPRIVDYFLYRAYVQGASDIHIEPMEEILMVRNRVDGILHEEITLPMDFHAEAVSRLKILSGMDVAEKRRPQDGRISTRISNNPIDVRVSSFPTVFGEKFVLRLLDKNALRPSMDGLGLVDRDLRLLKEKLGAPYGLVMISGPTGSGKTTTLYSCLGAIDKNRKNVLTVEDPVEYRLAGVHQMQVNHKIGLTFASGLRTILRQDPDVIMVGEIRDKETAEMAVQASLTGHIVFSTIHTNDAIGVVGRLLDMGMEPFLVATSLSLVIAQRLIRTICTHCRSTISGKEILFKLASEGVIQQRLAAVGIEIDPDMEYTHGNGCSHCRDSGYLGRRAVFEVFEITDEIRTMIMSPNMTSANLKGLARQAGMTSLISHGIQLVEEEVTTFEEVIRVLGEES